MAGAAAAGAVGIHKDFYLCHPDPQLQCPEFCFGDLQAAHPVLGGRSAEEVSKYRQEKGLQVDIVRGGRSVPKPFQSFQETSFPDFVIDLAYELFTTDAVPFPVQAQAWPCALSGMDVVAVAPTGSGKTLACLLPALVHIMAQPPLQPGEGPIMVMLAPTRELAQQTHAVAARFCERTTGDDTLRAGVAFGGVDVSLHLPVEDAPDHGRWSEILVATPGRLLMLIRSKRLSLSRTSYVVVDEADLLLSPGSWLDQVREILDLGRDDRQLLFISATWSGELQAVAEELCGNELARLRVFPDVPRIPQDVRLFMGGDDCAEHRKEALLDWLRRELRPHEAVLLLCASQSTAKELVADTELLAALGPAPDSAAAAGALAAEAAEDRWEAYHRFVRGELRLLATTFSAGARGLDYADTTAAAAEAARPSLVVVLLDFPRTISEYIHCIGRTLRPGQLAGRALVFMPEMRFWMAGELLQLLDRCDQPVPGELKELVARDRAFQTECSAAIARLQGGSCPWPNTPGGGCGRGSRGAAPPRGTPLISPYENSDFDAERHLWSLPPDLPSYRRRLVHALADEANLPHVSTGIPPCRRLHLAADRHSLPEKFFIEGEIVEAPPKKRRGRGNTDATASVGEAARRGRVRDPKIHPRWRTVVVRFEGEREDTFMSVDELRLCPSPAPA